MISLLLLAGIDDDRCDRMAGFEDVIESWRVADHDACSAVLQALLQFCRFAPAVQRDRDAAALHDGSEGDEPPGSVTHGNRYPRAGRNPTVLLQVAREGVYRGKKSIEGPALSGVLDKEGAQSNKNLNE